MVDFYGVHVECASPMDPMGTIIPSRERIHIPFSPPSWLFFLCLHDFLPVFSRGFGAGYVSGRFPGGYTTGEKSGESGPQNSPKDSGLA